MTSQEQLLLRLGVGGQCRLLISEMPVNILGLNFFSPRKKNIINVSDGFIIKYCYLNMILEF